MSKVGIGIVGAGHISVSHAGAVLKSPNTELVAVCDPDLTRARQLASAHGSPPTFGSLAEMLREQRVEAVIIATPNHLHVVQTNECAAAGRHVLCEKPIANTYSEALAVQKICDEHSVLLRSGFNQRFLNHVRLAKLAIERGVVGEIHGFRSVFSGKWDNYFDATNFRFNPEQSGGTTINDNLIHRYDIVRHLLGDDYVGIVADLAHSVIPPVVDDNVNLIVRTRRGVRGTFSADRYSPVIADSTEFYGTKGSIYFVTNAVSPFHAVPLAIFTSLAQDEVPAELLGAQFPLARARRVPGWSGWLTIWPQFNDTYAAQVEEFAHVIRGEPNAGIGATGIDGVRSTEVIHSAYLSQNESRWVNLPLPADAPYRVPTYGAAGGGA
jgi:predicted dehydrogenase